jgi:predicted nucleotide-binding protein
MKPNVLIGSSTEGLRIANAIHENIERETYPEIWTHNIFRVGDTTIDSLLNAVTNHSFGVFVLSPEDMTIIRGSAHPTARDNALFELALFMGR